MLQKFYGQDNLKYNIYILISYTLDQKKTNFPSLSVVVPFLFNLEIVLTFIKWKY